MNQSNQKFYSLTKKLEDLNPVLATEDKEDKVKEIGYFGSYASGEETESSDIDILVEFEEPLGWKFFSIMNILEEQLGRSVDLVTRKALKSSFENRY